MIVSAMPLKHGDWQEAKEHRTVSGTKCRRFTDRNTEKDKKYINREKKGNKVKRKQL